MLTSVLVPRGFTRPLAKGCAAEGIAKAKADSDKWGGTEGSKSTPHFALR
jgi:hypothetical protein